MRTLAMKILVANLGSTSFKYRLFDMTDERQLRAAASNGSVRRKVVVSSKVLGGGRIFRPTCPTMPRRCGKRSIN